ncbi:MAG: glycosyltransferase family 39 protein [Calditrichaeota bacterium]|nr:glycosyltransferase family 39 protein [Calditrichota bacterium]
MKFRDFIVEHKYFFYFMSALTLFRFVFINFTILTPQEAYYWYYSLKPALSYFDHPPVAAYSIWFGTTLFGKSFFGVKFMAVIWSLLTNLLLYMTVVRYKDDRTFPEKKALALSAVILFNLTVFAHLYAMIIVPDTPLIFFWMLCIFLFQEYLNYEKKKYILLAGLSLGFGLMSKYTAIMIAPGIFIFLLLSKEHRKKLADPYIYMAFILAFIVFSGVIYWNASHDWASFRFQFGDRTSGLKSIRTKYIFQLIGSQLFMLTPLVFVLFSGMTGKLFKNWNDRKNLQFFFLSGFFIVVAFTFISLKSLVKMNWLLPGYLGFILTTIFVFNAREITKKLITKIGIAFSLLLIVLLHLIPLIPNLPLGEGNTWSGWSDSAQKIAKLQDQFGGQDSCFVFTNSYKASSLIKFYLPADNNQEIYAQNIYNQPALQFDIWGKPETLNGKSALYIFDDRREYKNDLKKVEPFFDSLELIEEFQYFFAGKHTRTISCYLGKNYNDHK